MSTDPRAFDQTKPIVLAKYGTLAGHELHAGHPLTVADEPSKPGEVTADTAVRLWTSGKAVYADVARPTPVERPADAAKREAELEDIGGGWHMIRAPWLPEAVKVQGSEAAATKLADVIAEGTAHYEAVVRGTVVLDATPLPATPPAPVDDTPPAAVTAKSSRRTTAGGTED